MSIEAVDRVLPPPLPPLPHPFDSLVAALASRLVAARGLPRKPYSDELLVKLIVPIGFEGHHRGAAARPVYKHWDVRPV